MDHANIGPSKRLSGAQPPVQPESDFQVASISLRLDFWYHGLARYESNNNSAWWSIWRFDERKAIVYNLASDSIVKKTFFFPYDRDFSTMKVRYFLVIIQYANGLE
jgi:hypothetical protein